MKELDKRRTELFERLWAAKMYFRIQPMTLEEMQMPEGDFNWSTEEAGDWSVYCCGEKDCPVQWHKIASATDLKRENGVLTITDSTVDEDGNWDLNDEWTSEDGIDFSDSDLARSWSIDSFEYFTGWAQYWLECASTYSDPVADSFQAPETMTKKEWFSLCLGYAEEQIKCAESFLVASLAHKFADEVAAQLSPEEMAEVIAVNRKNPGSDFCHSAAIIDSNMAMRAAFIAYGIKDPDVTDDRITSLWNAAWTKAQAEDFFRKVNFSIV